MALSWRIDWFPFATLDFGLVRLFRLKDGLDAGDLLSQGVERGPAQSSFGSQAGFAWPPLRRAGGTGRAT